MWHCIDCMYLFLWLHYGVINNNNNNNNDNTHGIETVGAESCGLL